MGNKKINYHLLIKIWFITIIILVFLMIMVGGLTRLTDSGLSITKWQLFSGFLPPLSSADWDNYFDLYKDLIHIYFGILLISKFSLVVISPDK